MIYFAFSEWFQSGGEIDETARPIRLKSHTVRIKAPRELVYQMMSAVGAGGIRGDTNESSRIVCRNENNIVAEFKTKAGPFRYKTVEHIQLEPPERITFQHLGGPLRFAKEEFVYKDVNGETELTHDGEFIWRSYPIVGRLAGLLYTKPTFERVIEKHLEVIKDAAEARAARSHVFRRNTSE